MHWIYFFLPEDYQFIELNGKLASIDRPFSPWTIITIALILIFFAEDYFHCL
jgi:hypothetical protein